MKLPAEVEDRAVPESLGRRSAERLKKQLHSNARRASFTLCHADQGAEQRDGSCSGGFESACSQTPRYAETLADLGPRTGDAKHKDFTVATDVQVYFCDPQSTWQRGSNDNTNLLLRQYFPRGTDLSRYSQAQLNQVALRLNQRPRKTLGFQTTARKLHASVASTV